MPVTHLPGPLHTCTLTGQDVGPAEGAVQVVGEVDALPVIVPQVLEVHAYVVLAVVLLHVIERFEVLLTFTGEGFATGAWQTGGVAQLAVVYDCGALQVAFPAESSVATYQVPVSLSANPQEYPV